MTEIQPFTIDAPEQDLADLKQRLGRTRWPEAETPDDWSQGVPLAYAEEFCRYWAERYDWPSRQARLNRFPQFKTTIDGLGIHFIHAKSEAPGAWPLLITHGWPGSVVEFSRSSNPSPTRPPRAATPPTPFMSSALPCPATGSPTSRRRPAGAWSASRKFGTS